MAADDHSGFGNAPRTIHDLPKLDFGGGIDADGHVLEPPDLWERYLEPKLRSRALRIAKDEQGLEHLEIDGRASKIVRRGFPGGLGAMDRRGGIVYEREPSGSPYVDNAPFGAMDAAERMQRLDIEKLDKAVLYPTLGVLWVAECEDAELAQAYCRAYNRWIVDFCADSDGRLVPIAQLSLEDPAAAEQELRRAAEAGARGVYVPPFQHSRKPLGHPDHHRVFAAAAEVGVPFGIHPSFEPKWCAPGRFGEFTSFEYAFFNNVVAADAVRHAFTSLFQFGVFARFPELRVVVLESGASWIGYWLDRMDAVHESPQGLGVRKLLPEKPSHYFKQQCWIAGDPDETTLAGMIDRIGHDRFFWASDFPHPDHPPTYLDEVNRIAHQLAEPARSGFLGRNVAEAYGL